MKKRRKIVIENKRSLVTYIILRFLVILSAIAQSSKGNWDNVFLCIFTLFLFTLPTFIGHKLKVKLPDILESTVYVFIFAAEILGELQNFYNLFPNWDIMLHTLNGFLAAGVGFSLVDLLNKSDTLFSLSPLYVAIVAFCFSMTIGVAWEFFEYGVDKNFKMDMQKDELISNIYSVNFNEEGLNKVVPIEDITSTIIYYNNGNTLTINGYLDIGLIDTMNDLLVNFIGAFSFSLIGYFYIKNRDRYKFAENFIVTKKVN